MTQIENITPAPACDIEQKDRAVRELEEVIADLDAVLAEAALLFPDADPDTFLFGETK